VESPSMAEVGAPVIRSLGVAGYCSVMRPRSGHSRLGGMEAVPACSVPRAGEPAR
jgi:hypothetical protein